MTDTKLGRYHAPEPLSALQRLHWFKPEEIATFKTVDHEPKIGVLDQEDLHAQGIVCSQFIPGAGDPDALGSCTANTSIEALSNVLNDSAFAAAVHELGKATPEGNVYLDVVKAERAAIGFYHGCTDQTADSSSEWPPTDCGSSGPYMYQYAKQLGLISTEMVAQHTANNVVSLMQTDGLCWGTPWFSSWFQPDAAGFIDGNGSTSALEAAIRSGVAGGHEIYLSAIDKLAFFPGGGVDAANTVLRFRNHWGKSWCDQGSGLVHLSTILMLGGNVDLRQFRA